nr:UBP1-associated protein 2C-like [Ipomoea batatas]GME18497.1 UBP1-associated protein 2C-like [Ipomoea batatas]
MDFMKKRKLEDNGVVSNPSFLPRLSLEDARKILESFTRDQLFEIVQNALVRHPDVLGAVRSIADQDTTQRKLFIRGLGWETTTDKLRSLFSAYGELEEAVVILDKATGKSKGYGFITFKHIDGAMLALKEPSKQIDGRMTVTQLAAAGMQGGPGGGSSNNPVDISLRKIYVGNVPYDMPTERLLQHFSMYGEIEEGPLGFDKVTGKSKGYALFVYKTAEAARASIMEPVKNIDGKQLNCKLAIDGKKGKSGPSVPGGAQGPREGFGNDIGLGMQNGIGAQYGGPGGIPGYGGFSASTGGLGGGTNGYGAPGAGSGLPGVGGGIGAATGRGSSSYALPQSSAGMPSGDYPSQGMHYNFPSSGNQNRQNQPAGASPVPRVMHGGMYQGMPSYY